VLFTKYYQGNQIKDDNIGTSCQTHGEMINAYIILGGKPEGMRLYGRHR
jgi:hypothetical protein